MSVAEDSRCIYCASSGPFDEEHPLPYCLGEFEGLDLLDERVCVGCNNKIGVEAEQQFCRAGPESFFRVLLGISGRKGKEKINPFERGSAKGRAIDFIGADPTAKQPLLLELNPGQLSGRQLKQIVLVDNAGSAHNLRILRPGMEYPEQLSQALTSLGLTPADIQEARVYAAPEEVLAVEALVRGVFEVKWEPTADPRPIEHPVATFVFTEAYYRAIAKFAFHYFLRVVPAVHGSEPVFKDIRDFIRTGGDSYLFVVREKQDATFHPEPASTHRWAAHCAIVRVYQGRLEAWVQYFRGPNYETSAYRIKLAEHAGAFAPPRPIGHLFAYYPEGPHGRWHGEALPIPDPPAWPSSSWIAAGSRVESGINVSTGHFQIWFADGNGPSNHT